MTPRVGSHHDTVQISTAQPPVLIVGEAVSIAGQPTEQLEVEEPQDVDNVAYPSGWKLWLPMTSLFVAYFLNGLDLTIVAVAVPSLTQEFKTIDDIGCGMTLAAFLFFFGKVYSVFSIKPVFIFGLCAFELGSLLCTVAQTSHMFILGRALAGFGSSAIGGAYMKMVKVCFPLSRQALINSFIGGAQSVGLVSAPVIGGLLIDAFSWRACFGINLPLGVVCIIFVWFGFEDPTINPDVKLPWKEKLRRMNIFSVVLVVPAIVCLLMALQWGGIKFGWSDPRIIVLFVLFAILFAAFGYVQYRQGEEATVPLRFLKNRSVMAGMWYLACLNGVMAMTEYYIAIYFQGIRGVSATKSALLGLPLVAGLMIASLGAGAGITMIGYYYPFMYATSILVPIASGLLTTLDLDDSMVKVASLLGFLGFAVGLGMQSPMVAIQACLSAKEVATGGAIIFFGGGMGSALWICASATLFQTRLHDEVAKYAPATNITRLEHAGLSDLREVIGSESLKGVLSGYNVAVIQTLYMPLAVGAASIIGSVLMERRSIKKKQA